VELEYDISPEAEKAMRETKCGLICCSGHLGNWEVGAMLLTRYRSVTGIARPMKNPYVQRLMDRRGMRGDFETIDKHSGRPMDIVRALKRNRALAILSDQHASADNAVIIDFFGRKAATYSTPVVVQKLTGAPIVFAYAARIGFMRFKAHVSGPIFYDIPKEGKDEAVAKATQDLAGRLEAAIREYPGQYLWAHRRWKYAEALERGK
jgi:KDO2-lipid IV(A) lauroyltransferase